MNALKVVAAIRAQSVQRRKDAKSPDLLGPRDHALGVAEGMRRAVKIILEIDAEEQRAADKKKISRWLAADLRKACETALNMLKRGERARGITVLSTVLEKVSKQ